VNDKAENRDTNAGVSHVEGWERIGERNVQIEEQEIDDMTVEQTVGEISHDAGQEQSQRNVTQRVR
jgi:hypothetical protein